MERICEVDGCNNIGRHSGKKRKDGTDIRQKLCEMHHGIKYQLNGWDYKIYTKGSIQFADKSEGSWAAKSYKTKAQAKKELIKVIDKK